MLVIRPGSQSSYQRTDEFVPYPVQLYVRPVRAGFAAVALFLCHATARVGAHGLPTAAPRYAHDPRPTLSKAIPNQEWCAMGSRAATCGTKTAISHSPLSMRMKTSTSIKTVMKCSRTRA